MQLTKLQCDAFINNPTINPITNKKIKLGKSTHSMLMKSCRAQQMGGSSPKAPPMGPIIHWKMNASTPDQEQDNLREMLEHMQGRLELWQENENMVISRMEYNEFVEIIKKAKAIYQKEGEDDYVEYCDNFLDELKGLKKREFKEDEPKPDVYLSHEIKPSRLANRFKILTFYMNYESVKGLMNASLKAKEIHVESMNTIATFEKEKKVIDHMISLGIFTKDDIYKKTYKSEKWLEELQTLYKKYAELYKKVKGKSP